MRELELNANLRLLAGVPTTSSSDAAFDVGKHISLIPIFREAEVESYFSVFECIAVALRWPKDVWAILLQCRLTGKAAEACSSLSVKDNLVYKTVKNTILRVYEFVPEA